MSKSILWGTLLAVLPSLAMATTPCPFDSLTTSYTIHPFFNDHVVASTPILPGAGFLDASLVALAGQAKGVPIVVEGGMIRKALKLPGNEGQSLSVRVESGDKPTVTIKKGEDEHFRAKIAADAVRPTEPFAVPADATPVGEAELYDSLKAAGLDYGPNFRGLSHIKVQGKAGWGKVTLPANLSLDGHAIPPSQLDSAFHLIAAVVKGNLAGTSGDFVHIPIRFGKTSYFGGATREMNVKVEIIKEGDPRMQARVTLWNDKGDVVAVVDEVMIQKTAKEKLRESLAN